MRITGVLQRIGDRAGITVSLLCGIHCVVLAWALTTMPLVWFSQRLWGLPLAWYAWLESGLAIGAAVFAVLGLGLGWRRHRALGPGLLGIAGVLLVSTVLVIEWHARRWVGPGLVLGGGLLLVGAHGWNALKVSALGRPPAKRIHPTFGRTKVNFALMLIYSRYLACQLQTEREEWVPKP